MTQAPCGDRRPRQGVLLAASRHPLASVVSQGLEHAGVSADDPIVLAVSGGGDSMAMLALVAALRARRDPALRSLGVIAIDHGIRPENAEEAMLVVETAATLGVESARAVRVEIDRAGNLLDAARRARLSAMGAFAREFGARHVALAHQADDRAEGLVLGLSRGGGLEGLSTLRFRRELDGGLVLVRPMLHTRRDELRGFLHAVGVPWREDPSNALRARGAMRRDPAIAVLLDGIAKGSARALDEVAGLAELRDGLAEAVVPVSATTIPRGAFDAAHASVRAAILLRLARHAGASLPRAAIEQCVRISPNDRAPRCFDCGAGRVLRFDARAVSLD